MFYWKHVHKTDYNIDKLIGEFLDAMLLRQRTLRTSTGENIQRRINNKCPKKH